ncbi:MAG: nickel-dependent lactate racemase [Planctomycetota bacterium]
MKNQSVTLAFGRTGLTIRVHPEWTLLRPRHEPALPDPVGELTRSLRAPIASRPLREVIQPHERVALVTSDGTRPVPNRLLIPGLLEELPVPIEQVTVLIGTGTHRPSSDAELDAMFGPELAARVRIVNHDAFDPDRNEFVGTTASGTPVELDTEYLAADRRIAIGFIEPHFFAGFSGGPKAVAPGLASLETIFHLHSSRLIGDPKSTWGELECNPVHREVRAAVSLCPPDFLVNVTLNSDKEVTGFYCGDPNEAHRLGCDAARAVAMAPVRDLFDIVVTSNSGFPLDQNLYQTVKGISAAARIVRNSGTILVASECSDGIPNHGNFAELMRSGESPEDVLAAVLSREPILDQWQAQILAGLQMKAKIAVHSHLPSSVLESCKLEAATDLQQALDDAVNAAGDGARVALLPDGPLTIPTRVG